MMYTYEENRERLKYLWEKINMDMLDEFYYYIFERNNISLAAYTGTPYKSENEAFDRGYFSPGRRLNPHTQCLFRNVSYNDEMDMYNKLCHSLAFSLYGDYRSLAMMSPDVDFEETIAVQNESKKYTAPLHHLEGVLDFHKYRDCPEYRMQCFQRMKEARSRGFVSCDTSALHTSLQSMANRHSKEFWSNDSDVVDHNQHDNILRFVVDQFKPEIWKHYHDHKDIKQRFYDLGYKAPGDFNSYQEYWESQPNFESGFMMATSYKGIGAYFGQQVVLDLAGGKDFSVDEDDLYSSAGPGAKNTIRTYLFPNCTLKTEADYMDRLLFIRVFQDELFEKFGYDKNRMWRFNAPWQVNLITYGVEISCCQFGLYQKEKERVLKKYDGVPAFMIGENRRPPVDGFSKLANLDNMFDKDMKIQANVKLVK